MTPLLGIAEVARLLGLQDYRAPQGEHRGITVHPSVQRRADAV